MSKTEQLQEQNNIEKGLTPFLYKDINGKLLRNDRYVTFKRPRNMGILNALLTKQNIKYAGCHSFIKTVSYEKNDDVGFCFSQINCLYSVKEVAEYVKILQEIGFKLDYEFVSQNDANAALPSNFEGRAFLVKEGLHCFSISELYNERKCGWVRYLVFTMLRSLMGTANFYFAKRLIHFYNYFSKPKFKGKITLNEIFLFSLMCHQNVYDYKKHEKATPQTYVEVVPEIYLPFYAYHGFFGKTSSTSFCPNVSQRMTPEFVKKDREIAEKIFIFSGLLYHDNFDFMEYLTNLDKVVHKSCKDGNEHSVQNLYYSEIAACFDVLIIDDKIKEKFNSYLKKGFYFMAFKYVKQIIKFYYDTYPESLSYFNAFFKKEKKYTVNQLYQLSLKMPEKILTEKENEFLLNLKLKKSVSKKK